MITADYFLKKAEQCFRLAEMARQRRCIEVADECQMLANEFMVQSNALDQQPIAIPRRPLVPAYENAELSGAALARSSKFFTEETCQLPPRADRIPR
jgi:hypothetical protein